ncbi:MAG TPA: holo-ACP synthase [Clostridiaceae bacterium]|nr:holo-ACP synthase [Clostridiaceae bacterium]
MAIHCGIDIIEVDRIRKAIEKRGNSFKNKVFTENEISYCESKNASRYQSFAARFAAKEAASKALGTGFGGKISLKDIEIVNDSSNKPHLVLKGNAKELYDGMNAKSISVSLSHCKEYAIAQVIIETEER